MIQFRLNIVIMHRCLVFKYEFLSGINLDLIISCLYSNLVSGSLELNILKIYFNLAFHQRISLIRSYTLHPFFGF